MEAAVPIMPEHRPAPNSVTGVAFSLYGNRLPTTASNTELPSIRFKCSVLTIVKISTPSSEPGNRPNSA